MPTDDALPWPGGARAAISGAGAAISGAECVDDRTDAVPPSRAEFDTRALVEGLAGLAQVPRWLQVTGPKHPVTRIAWERSEACVTAPP